VVESVVRFARSVSGRTPKPALSAEVGVDGSHLRAGGCHRREVRAEDAVVGIDSSHFRQATAGPGPAVGIASFTSKQP
jgi:hypothetical protein